MIQMEYIAQNVDFCLMLKPINHITPDLSLSSDIAIVGSSGTPKKINWGTVIDDHSDIIRFNRAPIDGYEHIVGSKTTLRIVNNHVFDNIDATSEGYTGQPQYFVRDLRDERILYIAPDPGPWKRRKENTHWSNIIYLFDYETTSELKKKYNYSEKLHMSLGLIIILLCIESGIKPHLFGFDTMGLERTHYWEERPKAGPCHDIAKGQNIISKLARENKVEVYK